MLAQSVTRREVTATVPFVGCAAEGMSGPVVAPSGQPRQLSIPHDAANRLAYYSDSSDFTGLGVLAPRGWHCYETYGSDGAYLIVSPKPVSADTIYAVRHPLGFTEPVVVLSWNDGFTSGREEVSAVINRVFPRHRAFVKNAALSMDQPVPSYKGPFPDDELHYLSGEAVEFTTRAHREGLGTTLFLRPAALMITGVEMLVKDDGDCCDLISLAARLPSADALLYPVIVQQIEHDETHPRSSVPADPAGPKVR